MKAKTLTIMLAALVFSACERKNEKIQNELHLVEKTAKDTTQKNSVRESAGIFSEILSEKQGIPRSKLGRAHWEMVSSRNATTIATYVAFLKALEKQLPDELPSAEIYQTMEDTAGIATIIEYNVGQTVIMMSNSVRNISLYNDPAADVEVEGVLKRLKERHGESEAGKQILKLLNTVQKQGLGDRAQGFKPWESPGKSGAMD